VDGVSVEADGNFHEEWCSTGTEDSVTVDARASTEGLNRLRVVVVEVAEILRAVRAGAPVKPRALTIGVFGRNADHGSPSAKRSLTGSR
jgi:hypothetical protein